MLRLVIGNKNYSSWSMRAWVMLRHFDVDFEEIRIPLFTTDYKAELAKYSPTLTVPVLLDEELTIWDSLAVCEYVSDTLLEGKALPTDRVKRGLCRSYCAEMHAGFMAIRSQLPMNCRSRRQVEIGADLRADIDRLQSLWSQARQAYSADGEYLFGSFSMADAFFAPVVMRFKTYGIEVNEISQSYMNSVLENQAVLEWLQAARNEAESLPDFHFGEEITI